MSSDAATRWLMQDCISRHTNSSLPPPAYYVYADHLNTPQVVVDTNNATRWSWMPEPFGTTAPNTSPSGLASFTYNLRFPGQYYDAESGMHYNMQRSYVPGIGRYAQSDPIGLNGGITFLLQLRHAIVERRISKAD